jgi:hypothetical protein
MRRSRTCASLMPWRSLRSAPAQNTGPFALTSTSFTEGSWPAERAAVCSAPHIARLSAFLASGRFSVMVASPSRTV